MEKRKIKIEFINNYSDKIFPAQSFRDLTEKIIRSEKIDLSILRVIAVDDEYLCSLHNKYLGEDSYTDVMTFPLEEGKEREAEIYISADRAKINAGHYKVSQDEEIARLLVHGLLHLKGLDDKTERGRQHMHKMENELLGKFWQSSRSEKIIKTDQRRKHEN